MAAGRGEGVGLDQVLGQVTALVVSLLTHVTRIPVTKPVLSTVHPDCTLYNVHWLIVRVDRLEMLLQSDLGAAAEVTAFLRTLHPHIVVVHPEVALDVSHRLAAVAAELTAEWLLCGVSKFIKLSTLSLMKTFLVFPFNLFDAHLYLM